MGNTNITALNKEYIIDLSSNNNFVIIPAMQGDGNYVRYVTITLTNYGEEYEIPGGCSAVIAGTKPDGKEIFNPCEITDNKIVVEITSQMTAAAGRGNYEIRLMDDSHNSSISSFPFFVVVSEATFDVDYLKSSDEFRELDEIIMRAKSGFDDAIAECLAYADAASISADTAHVSEVNAANSAADAAATAESIVESVQAAAQSAVDAAASATNAANSATDAQTAATNAQTHETNAAGHANDALTQATASANSATASANSAADSATYANNASASATAAQTAENAAKASENAAKASEIAAKQSEDNAKDSETASKASEVAAGISEANAQNAATSAANSIVQVESWVHGGTGTRTGEDTDNGSYYLTQTTYYYNQTKDTYDSFDADIGETLRAVQEAEQNCIAAGQQAEDAADRMDARLTEAEEAISHAEEMADAVAANAQGASDSADAASASATAAAESATDAATSATNSASSATSSSDYATLAKKWAEWTDGALEPSPTNNARYWANKAKEWSGYEDLDASSITYTLENGSTVNLATFLHIIEELDGETLLIL